MGKLEYQKWYNSTPIGRASHLLSNYNRNDRKYDRGKGDLTAQWIVDNIFAKPCAHCGKTGWNVIGCNRLDNSKPHTKDNVEPCCNECNNRLHMMEKMKSIDQISITDGEIVKTWNNAYECMDYGFNQSHINSCCREERKTHKGYKWQFKPL